MNTKDSAIDNSYDPNLINFLPISTPDINILAVWAYNHRAKRFGDGFNGNTIDALDHYSEFLMQDKKLSLVVGDFNNSIIWDKGSNKNNFYQINAKLKSLGFLSNYHELENMKFGKESAATFFHTKKNLSHITSITFTLKDYSLQNLNSEVIRIGSNIAIMFL